MRGSWPLRSCSLAASCLSCRRLLGLTGKEDLRSAYLKAAWEHHPDSPRATKDGFLELKRCYEQLKTCCGKVEESLSALKSEWRLFESSFLDEIEVKPSFL